MNARQPIILNAVNCAGRGLRCTFVWHHDRFAHTILVVDGDRQFPLFASLEGSPEEAWPASPPLQNLHVEQINSREVALLVGMAGTSHWSLSVETGEQELIFDAACRIKGPSLVLGSSYRAMLDPIDSQASGVIVAFNSDNGHCVVRSIPVDSDSHVALNTTANALSIRPAISESSPATVRWKYSVALSDPADAQS